MYLFDKLVGKSIAEVKAVLDEKIALGAKELEYRFEEETEDEFACIIIGKHAKIYIEFDRQGIADEWDWCDIF